MFIDYLTLIMINMVGGTIVLAYYLWRGIDEADQCPYAATFFGVGLLALITGLHLSFTWPCRAVTTLVMARRPRSSVLFSYHGSGSLAGLEPDSRLNLCLLCGHRCNHCRSAHLFASTDERAADLSGRLHSGRLRRLGCFSISGVVKGQ